LSAPVFRFSAYRARSSFSPDYLPGTGPDSVPPHPLAAPLQFFRIPPPFLGYPSDLKRSFFTFFLLSPFFTVTPLCFHPAQGKLLVLGGVPFAQIVTFQTTGTPFFHTRLVTGSFFRLFFFQGLFLPSAKWSMFFAFPLFLVHFLKIVRSPFLPTGYRSPVLCFSPLSPFEATHVQPQPPETPPSPRRRVATTQHVVLF